MKKLASIALLLINFVVYADANATSVSNHRDNYYSSGYYLGLSLGQATGNIPDIAYFNRKNNGFSWRPYMGYNFNHYFSLDIGYLSLPTLKYLGEDKTMGIDTNISNSGYNALISLKYPLGEGFVAVGQFGGAMLQAKWTSPTESIKQNSTVWEYGGGLDYVWANIGGLHTAFMFNHLDKKDGENINLPSYDIYSLNVYYQF